MLIEQKTLLLHSQIAAKENDTDVDGDHLKELL
jgi:hypothetical protein